MLLDAILRPFCQFARGISTMLTTYYLNGERPLFEIENIASQTQYSSDYFCMKNGWKPSTSFRSRRILLLLGGISGGPAIDYFFNLS